MRAIYRTPAGLTWLLQHHLPPKGLSPGLQAASWGSPRQWAILIPTDSHLSRQPLLGATSCPGIRFTLSASGKCETNLLWWSSFKPSAPSQLLWVSSSLKFLIKSSIANRHISCHWKSTLPHPPKKTLYSHLKWWCNYTCWPKKVHCRSLHWKCGL